MQELLKISYEAENPTVSARELHDQLNIGTKFTTWFQRMTEYGFSENTDYKTCYPNLGSENHGGQNMVDYQISVDMAKEIIPCLVRTHAKRIRQYFIDLEKASAGVLTKTDDGEWIWRQHTWICADSPFIDSIKFPLRNAGQAEFEDFEVVPGPVIDVNLIVDWCMEQMRIFDIKKIAMDTYRYTLFKQAVSAECSQSI